MVLGLLELMFLAVPVAFVILGVVWLARRLNAIEGQATRAVDPAQLEKRVAELEESVANISSQLDHVIEGQRFVTALLEKRTGASSSGT